MEFNIPEKEDLLDEIYPISMESIKNTTLEIIREFLKDVILFIKKGLHKNLVMKLS